MDFRHDAEGLCCTAGGCGAGGRGCKLSVDGRPAGCCCCDSCESEGGSNGRVRGSEPSVAPFLRKKELPALRKELPNLVMLGLAAMMLLTDGDWTALNMSIDCLRATPSNT